MPSGSALLQAILESGTGPNGVFGMRLHWHQIETLHANFLGAQTLRTGVSDQHAGLAEALRAALGDVRFIWVRRRNVIAQAVAVLRAQAPDAMDVQAIRGLAAAFRQAERNWHAFFVQQRLQALIVVQEEFLAAYEPTVRGVLRYLGLDDPGLAIAIAPPHAAPSAEDAEWERQAAALSAAPASPRFTPIRRRGPRPSVARPAVRPDLPFVAYDLGSVPSMTVEPAGPARAWMDDTPSRFAYRCLPLVIANQAGWLIRNPCRLTARWDGTAATGGLTVEFDAPPDRPYATSHFGGGILTFGIGYLFRTPPGYNLQVRGPANMPKDGITALDAIVETDWTQATFTMNWKLTRPGHPVTFEVGEPIAMIAPMRRGELEQFRPAIQTLAATPDWHAGYTRWSDLRSSFNEALRTRQPDAVRAGWQRHYVQGVSVGDDPAPEHQTALALTPFADKRQA